MPNDAKLGLVLGIAVVIAIGVVYYRKDPGGAAPVDSAAISTDADGEARGQYRSTRGRPVNRGLATSTSTDSTDSDGPAIKAVAPDEQPPARE